MTTTTMVISGMRRTGRSSLSGNISALGPGGEVRGHDQAFAEEDVDTNSAIAVGAAFIGRGKADERGEDPQLARFIEPVFSADLSRFVLIEHVEVTDGESQLIGFGRTCRPGPGCNSGQKAEQGEKRGQTRQDGVFLRAPV